MNGNYKLFVGLSDTNGNIIKLKLIGNNTNIETSSPLNLLKKNLLVSGTNKSNMLYIIELDSLLNINWATKIDIGLVTGDCLLLPTSDTIIVGVSSSYFIGNYSNKDLYMFSLNKNGSFIWSKSFGFDATSGMIPRCILLTKNKEILVLSNTISKNGNLPISNFKFSIALSKHDLNGNLIWAKRYTLQDTLMLWGGGITELANGDLIICGGIETNGPQYGGGGLIMCLNKNGFIKWIKKIILSNHISFANDLFINQCILDKDNLNLFLYGSVKKSVISTSLGAIASGIRFLLNMDTSGNIHQIIKYQPSNSEFSPHSLDYYEWGLRSYLLKNSNSFIMGGGFYQLPFNPNPIENSQNKIFYLQTDSMGNSCDSDTISFTVDSVYILIDSGGIVTSVNQGTVASFTPTIIDDGVDSTICFCPDIPVTISKNPVNCFSNGSATITPQNNGNYTYIWNPPVSATNIASNLPAGNYTITITDSTGCKKTSVITITTNFNLPLSITGNSLICSSQTATLTLHGAQSLTWNTGQTDSIIVVQPSVTTTYSAVVVNGSCQDSVYFTVNVLPMPNVSVTPATYTLNIGDTAVVQLSGATYYSWNPSFGVVYTTSTTAYITPTANAIYCVTGTDSSKVCADTSCVQLYVEGSCFDIRVPNVFTPNGDNVNDDWGMEIPCVSLVNEFHLNIVDRWGVKIYEATKPNVRWDGRTISGESVPTGTYYYTAEFKINNKKEKLKGYITLMR